MTAHVRQAQIVSSALAFALLRPDGTVVTWGNPIDGGDSSAVQEELKDPRLHSWKSAILIEYKPKHKHIFCVCAVWQVFVRTLFISVFILVVFKTQGS